MALIDAFSEALDHATRQLERFATAAADGPERDPSGSFGEAVGDKIGKIVGEVISQTGAAGVGAAGAGFGTESITGVAGSGFSSAAGTLASFVGSIPLIGELTGYSQATDVTNRTKERVSGPLEDLARYGVEVSDSVIQRDIEEVMQQEIRTQDVRARVGADVDQRIYDAMPEELRDKAQEPVNKELVEAVLEIKRWLENFQGGSHR